MNSPPKDKAPPARSMSTPDPSDCARYDTCSVALCPLDQDWRKRGIVEGEAVCPYLLETGKPGDAVSRFAGRYDAFCLNAAVELRSKLEIEPNPKYRYILHRITLAAATPTMIDQEAARSERGKQLAARRQKQATADCGDRAGSTEPPAEGIHT